MHICPRQSGTTDCFFYGAGLPAEIICGYVLSGRWALENVGPAEQQKLLERFFRREYALLTQLLAPAPWPADDEDYEEVPGKWDDEGGTLSRDAYWTAIKEYRAKRGEPAELSSDEKQLSPEDCRELLYREKHLWHEKREKHIIRH